MLHGLLPVNTCAGAACSQTEGARLETSNTLCPLSLAPQHEIPEPYRYWSRENGQLYDSRWLRQHLHHDAHQRSPLTRRPMDADVRALWPERRDAQLRRALVQKIEAHEGSLKIILVSAGTAALVSALLCVVLTLMYEADPQRGNAATKNFYFAPLIPLGTLGLLSTGIAATSGLTLGLRWAWAHHGASRLPLSPAEHTLFLVPPIPALPEASAYPPRGR